MKKIKINLPIFKHEITVISLKKSDTFRQVKGCLKKIGVDEDLMNEIKENIENNVYDGGITLYQRSTFQFVVIIYPHTNKRTKLNTFNHEMHHCVKDIVDQLDINDYETPAYLQGYLSEFILDI